MSIKRQQLIRAFAESLGSEKAREILKDAASNAGVRLKASMDDEDAVAILEEISNMDNTTSYTRIASNTFITKIRTGEW